MTGTLTIRYLGGTLLGPIRAEAQVDRRQGVKTFALINRGFIADNLPAGLRKSRVVPTGIEPVTFRV